MRRQERDKPYMKDLFYVRKIVRNRCGYFDERVSFQMLEQALLGGVSAATLADVARGCRNWSSWRTEMDAILDELYAKEEDGGA